MTARLHTIEMEIIPDDAPDASYLEQDMFEDRLEAYRRGDFGFVGVRGVAEIHIPNGDGFIIQRITSPGVWGIEDDSGDDYFAEIYKDERETLLFMLHELNVKVSAEVES